MSTFLAFLTWLTDTFGADHPLVESVSGFEATDETTVDEWLDSFETLDDIDAFVASLRAAGVEVSDLADLETVADSIEYLTAYAAASEQAAADEAAAREELLSRITPAGDPEEEDEDEEAEEPEVVAVAAEVKPVKARNRRKAIAAARRNAEDLPAAPAKPGETWQMMKSTGGYAAHQILEGYDDNGVPVYGNALGEIMHNLGRGIPREDSKIMRTVLREYDDSRTFTGNSDSDSKKLSLALTQFKRDLAAAPASERIALVAGFCAPFQPVWDNQTVPGNDGRPVADFLVRFNASRGGVTLQPPANFAAGDFDGGVAIWTSANDDNPTDPTEKPCLTMDCVDPVSYEVAAVTRCLTVSNLRARANGEQVTMYERGLRNAQAQLAETTLINGIQNNSVLWTETGQVGFTRDVLETVTRSTTIQRDQQRMEQSEVVDVLMPDWTVRAMQADLGLEIPGAPANSLGITQEAIRAYFAPKNVRVGFFRDTQRLNQMAGAVGDPAAALPQWNLQFTYYQFLPGSYILLDDGILDLGVQRSPETNVTNSYQMFAEIFEGLAYFGIPGESHAITLETCVNGASVGTVDPAELCLSS